MALQSTSRPAIRGRVIPRLPATLAASGGLAVSKTAGVWTFEPDWTQLALETEMPADPSARQLWLLNPTTQVYSRISFEALTETFEEEGLAADIVQKADNFTFALTDLGAIVESTKATAMVGTIATNASVAFPVRSRIDLCQFGAGQLSIEAGVGVTISSAGGNLKLRTQYSGGLLYQRAIDDWVLIGDLTA